MKKFLCVFVLISLIVSSLFLFSLDVIAEEGKLENDNVDIPAIIEEEEICSNGYIAREKDLEKDLYTLSFLNKDGTHTMRVFDHQVKYVDEKGDIKDITLNLVDNGNCYITADNDIITSFPQNLDSGISISYNDIQIKMIPDNSSSFENAIFKEKEMMVSYTFDEKTEYQYSLSYEGFKESIVVYEYNDLHEYRFSIFTNGLELVNLNGRLSFVNSLGAICAEMSDVIVFTSDEKYNFFGEIEFREIKKCMEYEISIIVDDNFLKNECTKYPIIIDPSISFTRNINANDTQYGIIEDVTICQNNTYSGTATFLNVGRNSNGYLMRTLMKFHNLNMPVNFSPFILWAKVEIRDLICQSDENMEIYCYAYNEASPTWSESTTTTWNSVGNNITSVLCSHHLVSYNHGNVIGQHQRYAFDITNVVKEWSMGARSPEKGLVFTAGTEFETSGTNNWYKSFASKNRNSNQPSLTITYTTIGVYQICSYGHLIFEPLKVDYETYDVSTTSFSAENAYDGTCLWFIEYLPDYNAVTINSMGVRGYDGQRCCSLLTNSIGTSVLEKFDMAGPLGSYFRYIPEMLNGIYIAFKNEYSGFYISLPANENVLSSSYALNSSCALYISPVEIGTFNNFWTGNYTQGVTEEGLRIKINLDSKIKDSTNVNSSSTSNYYVKSDFTAISLWDDFSYFFTNDEEPAYVVIYGPDDIVPEDEITFEVTFKPENFLHLNYDDDQLIPYAYNPNLTFSAQQKFVLGQIVPNNINLQTYNYYSNDYKEQILASNWSSVTIYLNDNSDVNFNMLADPNLSSSEINEYKKSVICHELGHALKLAHPSEQNDYYLRYYENGMRGDYGTVNGVYDSYLANSSVYSVMNSPFEEYLYNGVTLNPYQPLTAITPQYHDFVNLTSKWIYEVYH